MRRPTVVLQRLGSNASTPSTTTIAMEQLSQDTTTSHHHRRHSLDDNETLGESDDDSKQEESKKKKRAAAVPLGLLRWHYYYCTTTRSHRKASSSSRNWGTFLLLTAVSFFLARQSYYHYKRQRSLFLSVLSTTHKRVGGIREHMVIYHDPTTTTTSSSNRNHHHHHRSIRTILVPSPSQHYHSKQRQQFNYHDIETEDELLMSYNDPDNGEAFDVRIVLAGTNNDDNHRQCYPIASWQTEKHQTCNTVHEVEMDGIIRHHGDDDGDDDDDDGSKKLSMEFINCGASRCTFLIENGDTNAGSNNQQHEERGDNSNTEHHFYHVPAGPITATARKSSNNDNKIVLKVTKNRDSGFSPDKHAKAARDALALEHLTASPYIMDIYGSCAVSQLAEYSSGGNIHDLLKRQRLFEERDGDEITDVSKSSKIRFANPALYRRHQLAAPLTKLKIAYQVATAVADMHGEESLPSMVHNDLCCHQFVLIDGVYKLGDFDWVTFQTATVRDDSSLLRKSQKKKQRQVCQTTPISFALEYLKVLAPEEMAYYEEQVTDARQALLSEGEEEELLDSAEHVKPHRTYRDKLDIYQIGNICYTLLTNWWVWEGYTINHALLANNAGEHSPFPLIPNDMPAKDHAALLALNKVVLMAWTKDPQKRPTARYLSDHLLEIIRQLDDDITADDEIIRISVPELPPDYRFTDSDFNANLEDPVEDDEEE